MDVKTFTARLRAIYDEANIKVFDLIEEAQKDEGLSYDTDKPISFAESDPGWERVADAFAELAGFIYDRMHGINRAHKKSMTKKLRKVLGYTYP